MTKSLKYHARPIPSVRTRFTPRTTKGAILQLAVTDLLQPPEFDISTSFAESEDRIR